MKTSILCKTDQIALQITQHIPYIIPKEAMLQTRL